MVGPDPLQLCARVVGTNTGEELPDLPLPPSKVRQQNLLLIGIGDLCGMRVLTTPTEQQVALASRSQNQPSVMQKAGGGVSPPPARLI